MKLRKACRIWAAAVLLMLLTVPVFAQTQGSLKLQQIEKSAVLYHVADREGVSTEAFSSIVKSKLTPENLSGELAKSLELFAQQKAIAGQVASANADKEIDFSSLDLGYYLVCSTAEEKEFASFVVSVPMTIGGKTIYHIKAQPKTDTPGEPGYSGEPGTTQPNIPQTGNILWPKYLLLILGGLFIIAGLVEILRPGRKGYE